MVSAIAPDPKSEHGHSPRHRHYYPRKDEAVEVSSDEEGFVGAWYPATVVECSPSKKRKTKLVIRYNTLVSDEDRGTPLTELVDPAFVRPVPPDDGGGVKLEVNDVVDAWYKDGWWRGVVRKVHEGKRYRILFDNPPDAIDFEVEDLRFHLDWVSGEWVRPDKQRPSEGVFSLGTEVEVNLEKGKVWFPAIVVKQNEDQTFLVRCESLKNCDDAESNVDILSVDSLHMRLPPCKSRSDYNLLDPVNAIIHGRWQKGKITRVLAGGLYTVLFPQHKEYRDFSWWTLRPDFQGDHAGSKTVSKAESKELVTALSNQEELDSHYTAADNPDLAVTPVSPPPSNNNPKEKTPSSSTTRIMVDGSSVHAKKLASDELTSTKRKKLKLDIPNTQLLPHKIVMGEDNREACLSATKHKVISSGPAKETLPDQVNLKIQRERLTKLTSSLGYDQLSAENNRIQGNHKLYSRKVAIVTSNARPTKSPVGSSLVSVTGIKEAEGVPKEVGPPINLGSGAVDQPPEYGRLTPLGDQKKGSETSGELSSEHNQQGSQERKRGRPQKLGFITSLTEAGIEISGTDDGSEMVVNIVTDEAGGRLQPEKNSTVPPNGVVGKNAHVSKIESLRKESADLVITLTQGAAEDNQPLSMWFGGLCSVTSVDEGSYGLHDRKRRQVDPATNLDVLPFVKRSPAWASIESMEVFRNMPQKPHFLPLMEFKEDYREGAAIGIMVTLSNLFEKISNLHIHDPRALFETTLISLSDLEKHGLDVTVPRDRINKLLSISEPLNKWLNVVEDAERELQQQVHERKQLDATIEEIEKKISALQQALGEAKAKMAAKEARAAIVHSKVDEMKGCIDDARNEFERLAASPWRYIEESD